MDVSYNAILTHLYVGSKDVFTEHFPFYFIVNCTVNIPFPKYPIEKQLRIPIEDDECDNIKMLEMMLYTNVLEKIYKCVCNKQNVLIYSEHGNQRSCALAACFLIRYLHMTPIRAICFVTDKRKNAFESENRFMNTIEYFYYYLQYEKGNKKNDEIQKQKIDIIKNKRIHPRIQPI